MAGFSSAVRRSLGWAIVPITLLAMLVLGAGPASAASSGSLVFLRGGAVWIARPDGSHLRRISAAGFTSPSESSGGAVLALGNDKRLYRFDRAGTQLAAPIATALTAPNPNEQFYGPFDPIISPDGLHQAYWFGANVFDPSCSCYDLQDFTRWGSALSFDEPQSQGEGQGSYSLPEWIDNQDLLLSSNGSSPLIAQLGTYRLGDPANSVSEWFSDQEANQVHAVAIAPTKDKLAVVADTNAGSKILLYRLNGPPPTLPSKACDIYGPAGGAFDHPTFSPDGTQLAFQDGAGIHVASLGNLSSCSGIQLQLVIAGASGPFWSSAAADCLVPSVHGKTFAQARQSLAAAGCQVGSVIRRRHGRRIRRVVSQRPAGGTDVAPGTRVSLTMG